MGVRWVWWMGRMRFVPSGLAGNGGTEFVDEVDEIHETDYGGDFSEN